MVSPLLVCECPLPLDFFRMVRDRAFLSRCVFLGLGLGDSGNSNGPGVRDRGTSMSPLAKGSSSGVRTRSTTMLSASDSTLVRRLTAPMNEFECGVGGIEPPPDENVVVVSKDEGVDSLDELVMTERLSFDLERSLFIFKERGIA